MWGGQRHGSRLASRATRTGSTTSRSSMTCWCHAQTTRPCGSGEGPAKVGQGEPACMQARCACCVSACRYLLAPCNAILPCRDAAQHAHTPLGLRHLLGSFPSEERGGNSGPAGRGVPHRPCGGWGAWEEAGGRGGKGSIGGRLVASSGSACASASACPVLRAICTVETLVAE